MVGHWPLKGKQLGDLAALASSQAPRVAAEQFPSLAQWSSFAGQSRNSDPSATCLMSGSPPHPILALTILNPDILPKKEFRMDFSKAHLKNQIFHS